jgi:hypothetical protein
MFSNRDAGTKSVYASITDLAGKEWIVELQPDGNDCKIKVFGGADVRRAVELTDANFEFFMTEYASDQDFAQKFYAFAKKRPETFTEELIDTRGDVGRTPAALGTFGAALLTAWQKAAQEKIDRKTTAMVQDGTEKKVLFTASSIEALQEEFKNKVLLTAGSLDEMKKSLKAMGNFEDDQISLVDNLDIFQKGKGVDYLTRAHYRWEIEDKDKTKFWAQIYADENTKTERFQLIPVKSRFKAADVKLLAERLASSDAAEISDIGGKKYLVEKKNGVLEFSTQVPKWKASQQDSYLKQQIDARNAPLFTAGNIDELKAKFGSKVVLEAPDLASLERQMRAISLFSDEDISQIIREMRQTKKYREGGREWTGPVFGTLKIWEDSGNFLIRDESFRDAMEVQRYTENGVEKFRLVEKSGFQAEDIKELEKLAPGASTSIWSNNNISKAPGRHYIIKRQTDGTFAVLLEKPESPWAASDPLSPIATPETQAINEVLGEGIGSMAWSAIKTVGRWAVESLSPLAFFRSSYWWGTDEEPGPAKFIYDMFAGSFEKTNQDYETAMRDPTIYNIHVASLSRRMKWVDIALNATIIYGVAKAPLQMAARKAIAKGLTTILEKDFAATMLKNTGKNIVVDWSSDMAKAYLASQLGKPGVQKLLLDAGVESLDELVLKKPGLVNKLLQEMGIKERISVPKSTVKYVGRKTSESLSTAFEKVGSWLRFDAIKGNWTLFTSDKTQALNVWCDDIVRIAGGDPPVKSKFIQFFIDSHKASNREYIINQFADAYLNKKGVTSATDAQIAEATKFATQQVDAAFKEAAKTTGSIGDYISRLDSELNKRFSPIAPVSSTQPIVSNDIGMNPFFVAKQGIGMGPISPGLAIDEPFQKATQDIAKRFFKNRGITVPGGELPGAKASLLGSVKYPPKVKGTTTVSQKQLLGTVPKVVAKEVITEASEKGLVGRTWEKIKLWHTHPLEMLKKMKPNPKNPEAILKTVDEMLPALKQQREFVVKEIGALEQSIKGIGEGAMSLEKADALKLKLSVAEENFSSLLKKVAPGKGFDLRFASQEELNGMLSTIEKTNPQTANRLRLLCNEINETRALLLDPAKGDKMFMQSELDALVAKSKVLAKEILACNKLVKASEKGLHSKEFKKAIGVAYLELEGLEKTSLKNAIIDLKAYMKTSPYKKELERRLAERQSLRLRESELKITIGELDPEQLKAAITKVKNKHPELVFDPEKLQVSKSIIGEVNDELALTGLKGPQIAALNELIEVQFKLDAIHTALLKTMSAIQTAAKIPLSLAGIYYAVSGFPQNVAIAKTMEWAGRHPFSSAALLTGYFMQELPYLEQPKRKTSTERRTTSATGAKATVPQGENNPDAFDNSRVEQPEFILDATTWDTYKNELIPEENHKYIVLMDKMALMVEEIGPASHAAILDAVNKASNGNIVVARKTFSEALSTANQELIFTEEDLEDNDIPSDLINKFKNCIYKACKLP